MEEITKSPENIQEITPGKTRLIEWADPIVARMEACNAIDNFHKMTKRLEEMLSSGNPEEISAAEEMIDLIKNDRMEETVQEMNRDSDRIHFLSDWIALVKDAGIKFVPIEKGPLVSTEDVEQTFEALDARDPSHMPRNIVENVLPWIVSQQQRGWMWRFEWCATKMIKEVLGTIREDDYIQTTRVEVPFSVDQRVLHCMWDTGSEESHLVARPWQAATFHNGFPVEFRVFRTKTGEAVCNYYVQRGLPPEQEENALKAVELARQIDVFAKATGRFIPEEYTTDWILTDTGELMFLEAGPGFNRHGPGAHPCCFHPDKLSAGRVLLQTEPGAITWCPPEVQTAVDKVKAGENPMQVCKETGQNPHEVLAHAAVQGYKKAQEVLDHITKRQFLEYEKGILENS